MADTIRYQMIKQNFPDDNTILNDDEKIEVMDLLERLVQDYDISTDELNIILDALNIVEDAGKEQIADLGHELDDMQQIANNLEDLRELDD